MVSELECILDEIDDDLFQPDLISLQVRKFRLYDIAFLSELLLLAVHE